VKISDVNGKELVAKRKIIVVICNYTSLQLCRQSK